MAFFSIIWEGIKILLLTWKDLFLAPFYNFEILWIVIPIYINWIIADIYQEKKGTSLGNAISNGVVTLWVGIDWARYLTMNYSGINVSFIINILITLIVFGYGLSITIMGIRANKLTTYLGRIREVSYLMIMFSPVIYGLVKINFVVLLTMIIGLPIFYFLFELVFMLIPDPKSYSVEKEMGEGNAKKTTTQNSDTFNIDANKTATPSTDIFSSTPPFSNPVNQQVTTNNYNYGYSNNSNPNSNQNINNFNTRPR